jgi:azobenzene reductase
MQETPVNVLAVVGSLKGESVTRAVITHTAQRLAACECVVDVWDLLSEPLPLFNPDTCDNLPEYAKYCARVDRADVLLLGTPDYHGSISGSMKNFLDFFWREFAGKLFATVVASHEKGLTVTDQLRTIARQCYAWTLPYGVSCMKDSDVRPDGTFTPKFSERLEMLVRDTCVYGSLLAQQRHADLAGSEAGFLARHRNG